MKFYITQETKQELEDKIAELKKEYDIKSKITDNQWCSIISGQIISFEEILSNSVVLPFEENHDNPIITGNDDEWEVLDIGERKIYQNKKCSGLFKENEKCIYKHAIMWNLKEKNHKFNGMVYVDTKNFEMIGSGHYVKSFPFVPKTFYIDVELIPITKEKVEEKKLDYVKDDLGNLYIKVIKDPGQLDEVFKFYNKKLKKN